MSRRVGVVSAWPSPDFAALLGIRGRLPYPLEAPGVRLFAQARQALSAGLPALGLVRGDEVLVPTYHHGSEIEAILRAGLHCIPYDPGRDLQPDQDQLDRLLGPKTRALHLVHYLGFPQDAGRWRRWCDERGLLLVEDAAQAWLSERDGVPVGSHGDLAVFCLYKSVGVADGAAARSAFPLTGPSGHGALGLGYLVRPVARAGLAHLRRGRIPEYDQTADIIVPAVGRQPSMTTRWMLPRAVGRDVAEHRRSAYRYLLERLRELVPEPFDVLPAGASPFVFPIVVADKADALAALEQRGIRALDFWSRSHPAVGGDRPGGSPVEALRTSLLGLPVHVGVRLVDLQQVVDVASTFRRAPRTEPAPRAGVSPSA